MRDEEAIRIPIGDSLDLHSFLPQEIPDLLEEYLRVAQEAGIYEIRIIHGRGIGVQRRIVQSLLSRSPLVRSFRDAPAERGGWGATLVTLCHRGFSSPQESEKEK